MASYTYTVGSTTSGHPTLSGSTEPYVIKRTIDIATMITALGATPAATDVIKVLNIPSGSMVLSAGVYVGTAVNATTMTVDLGYSGNVDVFTDGADLKTTGFAAYGTNGKAIANTARFTSASTLDLTVATLTGTLTSGSITVYALVVDIA